MWPFTGLNTFALAMTGVPKWHTAIRSTFGADLMSVFKVV
jgi:hypothetical protein